MNTLENRPLLEKSGSTRASPGTALIINADDWGRDQANTDRIRECFLHGTVSSVSAMVFMLDSERAAEIALESGVDAGLHLNFTTPFSASHCSAKLTEHQRRAVAFLRHHRLAKVVYHPGLTHSFQYVFESQMEQFHRLYRRAPNRLDGHHHMHLCANVLFGKLLPTGMIVRRNFCFTKEEKGLVNRTYRQILDHFLARHHRIVDFFTTLAPLEPAARLQRILSYGSQCIVELETHPVEPAEYLFLMTEGILAQLGGLSIARKFELA